MIFHNRKNPKANMNLCCQINPARECSLCGSTTCIDCSTYAHIGVTSWSRIRAYFNKLTPLVCKGCIKKGKVARLVEKRKKNMKKTKIYSRLKYWTDWLQKKKRTNAELLRALHQTRDDCWAYGSATNAGYAKEVTEWLIKEHKLSK